MFNKKQFVMAALGISLLGAITSNIANAGISQTPLFVGESPHPNIMFTLDNSGSMNWQFLPDNIGCFDAQYFLNFKTYYNVGDCDGEWRDVRDFELRRYRAAGVNKIFYDPTIRYLPWQKADKSYYPDSVPSAAVLDPRAPASPENTVNLIEDNDSRIKHCPKLSTFTLDKNNRRVEVPPVCGASELVTLQKFITFYYVYTPGTAPNDYDSRKYVRHEINSTWVGPSKGDDRTDCAGTVCTYIEEQKNFANWFTYYRKRIFTAIAGVSQAFNPLDGKQRVGYGKINLGNSLRASNTVDGVRNLTVLKGVREFIGSDRDTFYDQLFENVTPASGTPLREAMDEVGKYFSRSDEKGPWAENPGVSKGVESACRKSFHILMTDGLWNGNNASTEAARVAENTSVDTIPNPIPNAPTYTYNKDTVGKFYNSKNANTLSNIAMYYWNHDLRPDIDNYVKPSDTDPAYWQHLVQYTVGLGVNGTLDFPGDTDSLKTGTAKWPDPGANGNNSAAVDDLWHAAVNGHGIYFSAKNPKVFRESLIAALNDIATQTGAASSVALNFDEAGGTNTSAYVPGFDSTWVGHLSARKVDQAGLLTGEILWSAEDLLPLAANRNIVTFSPVTPVGGIPFKFDNLTAAQKAAVGTTDVVDYLRGSDVKEVTKEGGIFRKRTKKLGDIVNSGPTYVYKLDNGYGSLNGYRGFVASKSSRNPMVYVGANDGMLHAFDAATGVETFAYVPNSVFPFLKSLSQTNYEHHFFVDGPLNEGDAVNSSNQWRTLLAGSTGAGARSVFMLDVTNPGTVASPSLTTSNVLWERSGEAGFDSDLGNVLSKIEVVRLRNGKWAAIFGNGYGSTNKKAVLYIVDAFTGTAITGVPEKIVFSTTNTDANGLAQPALLFNSDRQLLAAYAGDLQGNLWKVEFGADGKGSTAFNGVPLFTTKDDDLTTPHTQPITQRPALAAHPNGGYLVMFGTGKYFDVGDQATVGQQTVYGIWDKPNGSAIPNSTGRNSALQKQTLTEIKEGDKVVAASLSNIALDTSKSGWYVDLILTGARAVGNPYVTDDTTLFVNALSPEKVSCSGGGKSTLYSFNFVTGGATHAFDNSDEANRPSAIVSEIGTIASPTSVRVPGVVSPAQPTPCPTCAIPAPAAVCATRKIILNHLDGSQSQRVINSQCKAPFRTWHLLNN